MLIGTKKHYLGVIYHASLEKVVTETSRITAMQLYSVIVCYKHEICRRQPSCFCWRTAVARITWRFWESQCRHWETGALGRLSLRNLFS